MQSKIPTSETFFSRLQNAVNFRQTSLAGLSGSTGIALSTIYRWKEGGKPHNRTSKQIAEKLRISEEWLRKGTGEMESTSSMHQEEATPYKFTQRGPVPQPTQAAELHSGCQMMLNAMSNAGTVQAFDYAASSFEEAWEKFKVAKYSELNQIPP